MQNLGFLSGSVSVTRYHLVGRNKPVMIKEVDAFFKRHQANNENLQSSELEEQCGWVHPAVTLSKHDPDAYWDISDCQFEEGFILKMRIARKKVSPALLQLVYNRELKKLGEQSQKTLGSQKRKELKERLKLKLLKSALPSLSFVDAYWNETTKEVLLFSTSGKTRELFENLFRKSFCEPLNLTMIQSIPVLMGRNAMQMQDPTELSKIVESISQTLPVSIHDGVQI